MGLTTCWAIVGPESLYWVAFLGLVGVVVVHLVRVSEDVDVGYWRGAFAGLHAMSWMGLLLAFGLAGLLWVCALVATTGPARWLWARRVRGSTAAPPTPEPGRETADLGPTSRQLPDLDLGGLCRAWRRSYFTLLDARPPTSRAAVVDYRQRILDEIDHRDPQGLSLWLASGPPASGNPLPFLHTDSAPGGHGGADAA
ncbi:hypothetical protein [Nocardioides sp. GXQ0305]|uniref:hypothetical protein n=1 Tax=Nocardioides sp. GXQ0305 TaxID=3423912 RepID=UPI003D7E9095